MENFYSEEIQQFITANNLTRQAGLILFDAEITLEQSGGSKTVFSPVQIISLDNVTALYIYEFFKTEYDTAEMFSTEEFVFTCCNNSLEVKEKTVQSGLRITVKAVTNPRITSIP